MSLTLKQTILTTSLIALISACSSTQTDDAAQATDQQPSNANTSIKDAGTENQWDCTTDTAKGDIETGSCIQEQASVSAPAPKKMPAPKKIVTFKLTAQFDFDSSSIRAQDIAEIDQVSDKFLQNKPLVLLIEGYTDIIGSRDYNLKLANARAEAVANILVKNNVPKESIAIVAIGPDNAVASNDTETGRAQNRRIVTHLVYQEEQMTAQITP